MARHNSTLLVVMVGLALACGDGSEATRLASKSVAVTGPNRLPIGWVDNASNPAGSSTVRPREKVTAIGWAADWEDGTTPTHVTVSVDGNDLFAVYKAHKDAVERARSGGGPSFIDCVTYRLGDHTTADDARRYRSAEEMEIWKKRDPLIRTRNFLESRGLWDETQQKKTQALAKARIQDVTQASIR